jgi:hypothetical protein
VAFTAATVGKGAVSDGGVGHASRCRAGLGVDETSSTLWIGGLDARVGARPHAREKRKQAESGSCRVSGGGVGSAYLEKAESGVEAAEGC